MALRFILIFACIAMPRVGSAQGCPQPSVDRARALFMDGVTAYESGQLQVALRKLLDAHGLCKMPELAFNIARVYERMSNVEEATKWFRIYLRRGNPDAATRADIEQRMQELAAVDQRRREQIFIAAPSNDELTAEAARFFESGVAMFRREEYGAAFEAFSAVLQLSPQLVEVYYNLAVTCERLHKVNDAVEFYRTYLIERRAALGRWPPDAGLVRARVRRLQEQAAGTASSAQG